MILPSLTLFASTFLGFSSHRKDSPVIASFDWRTKNLAPVCLRLLKTYSKHLRKLLPFLWLSWLIYYKESSKLNNLFYIAENILVYPLGSKVKVCMQFALRSIDQLLYIWYLHPRNHIIGWVHHRWKSIYKYHRVKIFREFLSLLLSHNTLFSYLLNRSWYRWEKHRFIMVAR